MTEATATQTSMVQQCCRTPHPIVICVGCGLNTSHYRITALDGLPRCRVCHVAAAEAARRKGMK